MLARIVLALILAVPTAAAAQSKWADCRANSAKLMGLSRDQVRAKCGREHKSYRAFTSYPKGVIESMSYGAGANRLMIYLENGRVTEVEK
jgi:hypothetical protein